MRIHAVQMDIAWEDRPANHARARALIETTDVRPGDLVVLPEMFDTGFSMNTAATAQPADRPSDTFLASLARTTGAAILAGIVSPPTDPPADPRPANEALLMGPEGEIARYRKTRGFTPAGEHERFVQGDGFRLAEWGGMKIAPFICYDLRFPELFRPAAFAGAELIAVVANWPARRSEHWVRLLQARAIENQCYVLGVNRCGADPALSYDGRSALFDPLGACVFELDGTEQVKTAEIDPEAVRKWRADFPALADARRK